MLTDDRLVKVKVSTQVLGELLRGRCMPVGETDAPQDLEVVATEQNFDGIHGKWFWVYLRSESFAVVPEGALVPEHTPFIYTRTGTTMN